MKTLIGIVLDESSSMCCRKGEVLNGFRTFIEDQMKITEDSARLFLVKFHSTVTVVHKGIPLKDVKPLTELDYQPQGSTALNDAIAQCVQIMDEEKTAEERAICVIMTDGEENCSQKTSSRDIRNMIREREQLTDWTFIYIGVEIEQWMRESGMSRQHCSVGFSPTSAPPPYSSGRHSVFGRHGFLGRFGFNQQRTDQNANNAPDSLEPVQSEEITSLSSAMSNFRSSRQQRSSDFFSSVTPPPKPSSDGST